MSYIQFRKGDRVRLKAGINTGATHLDPQSVYVVGAVADLQDPQGWHVDPFYWSDPKWAWAKEKTRLQVSGHPQCIFFDGIFEYHHGTIDPEGHARRSFSGYWFQLVVD